MALRYTDTELWNKDWFLDLEPKQKLLTYFLYTNCDCAGFLEISWRKIKFSFMGAEITKADFLKIKSLIFISDDVIFLQDFLFEQYKIKSLNELNPNSSIHKGILKRFEYYNQMLNFKPFDNPYKTLTKPFDNPYKTLTKPFDNPLVRVKDKDKDKDKDNHQSNKEERETNKEREESFENQNSDFEKINEINETETETPLKFADLPENLKECGIYGNNALLEAKKEENKGVFKPPKATDPYINPELDRYFRVYEELCPNLARLRFERRNAQIRELLARFIDEIDDDVGYFKSLCQKANNLKRICEKPIDFKMLINNHIGIFNGKYENDSFDVMDLFKKKQE